MLASMRRHFLAIALLAASTVHAQAPATDALAPLDFLTGPWIAATNAPAGSSSGNVLGTYTFTRTLAGHALERTGTVASCKGPQDFDCNHHDSLIIFPEAGALAALYLDNEGHVIHYLITLPDPHTAIFLSQGPPQAPRFRLTYHLEGTGPKAIMTGKFQFAPPGSDDFHSYLEWSGTKQ